MALTSWIVPIMHKIANHSKLYWDAYWLVLNISPCFALITRMDIYCFLHIHCHHPSPFWGLWTKYILTSLPTLGSCASDQTQHDTCSPDPNYSVTHFALVSVMISGKGSFVPMISQQFPNFLEPGIDFLEDNFSTDQV